MERPKRVEYDDKDGSNLSPSKDESLRDFKSPTTEPVARASSKVKIVPIQNEKKAVKDWRLNKDTVANSGRVTPCWAKKFKDQSSIESALSKSPNDRNKRGHSCPLCLRYYGHVPSGIAHTKYCAKKYGISPEQLQDAVKLHKRQEEERIAIGLPGCALDQPKDKIPRKNHAPVLKKDLDLQLALALSKSLQEEELEREFEEAVLLAGQHCGNEPVVGITGSQRRLTLENFGFTRDKPEPSRATFETGRWKRKKNLGPTILETRTEESRDRLLTEKIAEVLMGNEAITQVLQQSPTDRVDRSKESRRILESRPLNKIHRTTERLWDSAQLSPEITNFYAEDLRPVLVPIADCQQDKSLNSRREKHEFETEGKDDDSSGGSNTKTLGPDGNDEISKTSEDPHDANKSVEKAINMHITDRQYRNSLIADWSNTLNVSSMSDVVVIVKNNYVWSHKLVFFVRCPDILVHCESNDDARFPRVREKIAWLDVDYLIALTFLEFVYSGVIEKYSHAFDDNRVMAHVRRLGRKYRLESLFDYLCKRKREIDILRETKLCAPIVIDCDEIQNEEIDIRESEDQTENGKICQDEIEESSVVKGDASDLPSRSIHGGKIVESFVEKSNVSSEKIVDNDSLEIISISSSRSSTPDLFDDTIDAQRKKHEKKNCDERAKEEGEPSGEENLNILAQLIAEDGAKEEGEPSGEENLNILAQLIAEDVPIGENSQNSSTSTLSGITAQSPLRNVEIERVEARSSRTTEPLRSLEINADTRKLDESTGSQNLAIKPKSNLSLFIDKIQRTNAKSAMDSDSEDDTLGMTGDRQRFKNPFNINNISNESLGKSEENAQIASENWFVDETSRSTQKNHNESSFKDETIDPDDENVSMYSKYKINNEKNNSIVTYRVLLADETGIAAKEEEDNEKETFSNEINSKETFDTDFDVSTSFSFGTRTAKNRKSDNNDSKDSSILPKFDNKVNDVNDDAIVSEKDIKDSRGAKSPSTFHERINEKTNNMTNSFELLDEFQADVDGIFVEKTRLSSKKSSLSSPKNSSPNNEISKERTKEYVISDSGNEKIVKHAAEKSSHQVKSSKTLKEDDNDCEIIEINDSIFSQSFQNSKQLPQSQTEKKRANTPKKKSRLSVSPPANYESLDTPQLKRELDRYGIKPQRQKRARQMLYHIRDRLQDDKSPKNDKGVARRDDDESPVNKKSRKNYSDSNDTSLSQESVESEVTIIAEKTIFPDSVDVSPNKIANSTSIQQAFHELMKVDKEIYHKVLTYEPLSLEELHLRLKEQGFKCKLNALMEFLDQQCITFKVVQLDKSRTRGRGKKLFED